MSSASNIPWISDLFGIQYWQNIVWLSFEFNSTSNLLFITTIYMWFSQGQSSVEAGMAANTNADYNSKIIKAEEEFVKLMEVDISSAMRFLQKKGLCLMPISLAAVISNKDSSSACSTDAKER